MSDVATAVQAAPAPTARDLRRDFANRDDLVAYIAAQFPDAAAGDAQVAEIRGGRRAAEAGMRALRVGDYAPSRHYLSGAVSRLCPYLRYGVVSLAEIHDAALGSVRRRSDAAKFVQELAWRDYFQRVYDKLGDRIWDDREEYKTGYPAAYAPTLPDDVRDAATGLPCTDGFARDLRETGYLHNHARMWLAAYLVHWRRVRWQAGASWFLCHVLDGDPASNARSWQWVASTFAPKPYLFNRENLEQYTDGRYCRTCPLHGRGPFEGTYDDLQGRLLRSVPTPPGTDPGRRGASRHDRHETGRRQRDRW